MKTKVLQKILSFARFDDDVVVFKHKAVVQNAPFESTGKTMHALKNTALSLDVKCFITIPPCQYNRQYNVRVP